MSLKLDYRFESGAVIETLVPAFRELDGILPDISDLQYPYLRLIDRYGDTFFSRLQMLAVLPELETLKSQLAEPELILDKVIELALRCRGEPHSFLVFIGD